MPSGVSPFCYGFLFYLLIAAPQGPLCKGAGRPEQLALRAIFVVGVMTIKW